MIDISKTTAKAIVNKIKKQRPDTPEAKLMFAIFEQAVSDLFQPEHRTSAVSYLASNMPQLEAIGIDSKWVRQLFKSATAFDENQRLKATP